MALRNTASSWGWPARLLHWAMALTIVGTWILGKQMVDVPDTELMRKLELYQLHKSIGVTLWLLALLRLAWRLANPTPLLPAGLPAWQRHAAGVSHLLLYVLLIAIPVTGYLMVSASPLGIPTIIFDTLPLPHVLAPDGGLEATLKAVHEALGNVLAVLVLIHVGAALKHLLAGQRRIVARMVTG